MNFIFVNFLLLLLALVPLHSFGQLQLSGYGTTGIQLGKLKSYTATGWGAGMNCRYQFLEEQISVGIKGEYISFQPSPAFNKTNGGIYYSVVPILLFGRYQFNPSVEFLQPYVGLGLGIFHENITAGSSAFGIHAFRDYNKLSLGVSPEAGINLLIQPDFSIFVNTSLHVILSGIANERYGNNPQVNLSGGTSLLTFQTGITYTFPK